MKMVLIESLEGDLRDWTDILRLSSVTEFSPSILQFKNLLVNRKDLKYRFNNDLIDAVAKNPKILDCWTKGLYYECDNEFNIELSIIDIPDNATDVRISTDCWNSGYDSDPYGYYEHAIWVENGKMYSSSEEAFEV